MLNPSTARSASRRRGRPPHRVITPPRYAFPAWPHPGNLLYGGMAKKRAPTELVPAAIDAAYGAVLADVTHLLESARRTAARSVNSIMAATYWAVGRRIVEFEQGGKDRAAYGTRLIARLAGDLTRRFGRGFGAVNLAQMRKFYQTWPKPGDFSDGV
jgi:hypothetical protein